MENVSGKYEGNMQLYARNGDDDALRKCLDNL